VKHTLMRPVKLGREEITEFTLREETTVADIYGLTLSAIQNPKTEDVLLVLGRISGQPDHVLGQLSVPDFNILTLYVIGFLGSGLPTSGTASES
jgi:hypothetical protein